MALKERHLWIVKLEDKAQYLGQCGYGSFSEARIFESEEDALERCIEDTEHPQMVTLIFCEQESSWLALQSFDKQLEPKAKTCEWEWIIRIIDNGQKKGTWKTACSTEVHALTPYCPNCGGYVVEKKL